MGGSDVRALAVLVAFGGCAFERVAAVDAGADATNDGTVVDASALDAAEPDALDAAEPDALDAAALDAADARIVDAPLVDARVDAAVDAAIDAPPACPQGARRCEGNTVSECQAGTWTPIQVCSNLCAQGGCVTPPSCSGGVATCGSAGTETCCRSVPVPAATFSRSYDGVTYTDARYQATVSGFHLDRYEVTVARFQAFVAAYPASQPAVGAGRNPRDAADPGWKAEWTALLPATQADLSAALACDAVTTQATGDPVRCVSWYVAQAFCIWDGGRLPTEAEWNAAAAGGAEQRVYPWSSPPPDPAIDGTRAVYATTAPARPGSRSPAGDGRWGHADLAGNLWEWVLDSYAAPYPSDTCRDCANHTAASFRGNRGGAYVSAAASLLAANRGSLDPAMRRQTIGVRCARNPVP